MEETSKNPSLVKEKTRKNRKGRNLGIAVNDIDLMSKKELRRYISKLEKDLKQMRINCNHTSDDRNKIISFVKQEEEVYLEKKHCLAAKGFKADDTIQEFENNLKNFRLKTVNRILQKHEQQALESFTSFLNKNSEKLFKNKLEQKQDAERFSVVESLLSDIGTMDMIACDLFGNYKNWSQDASFEYVIKCRDAMHKFNAIKLRILNSIWNFDFSDEEPIAVEIEKMQFYFNELHEDNLKSFEMWRKKIKLLQDQLEKLYTDLNKALHLNAALQKANSVPNTKSDKSTGFNGELCKNEISMTDPTIDKMTISNLELKNKLKCKEAEKLNLKRLFVSNVRKIYQVAEFKSLVAEEAIRLGLAIKEAETSDSNKRSITQAKFNHFEVKNNIKTEQEFQGTNRLIKLSCSNTNTLFVPPVF